MKNFKIFYYIVKLINKTYKIIKLLIIMIYLIPLVKTNTTTPVLLSADEVQERLLLESTFLLIFINVDIALHAAHPIFILFCT